MVVLECPGREIIIMNSFPQKTSVVLRKGHLCACVFSCQPVLDGCWLFIVHVGVEREQHW